MSDCNECEEQSGCYHWNQIKDTKEPTGIGQCPEFKPKIRTYRFVLERVEDVTGVSGTGIIAHGVRLPTGRCVMEWAGEIEHSIVIWSSVAAMLIVVTHKGKNQTNIRWIDPIPPIDHPLDLKGVE